MGEEAEQQLITLMRLGHDQLYKIYLRLLRLWPRPVIRILIWFSETDLADKLPGQLQFLTIVLSQES